MGPQAAGRRERSSAAFQMSVNLRLPVAAAKAADFRCFCPVFPAFPRLSFASSPSAFPLHGIFPRGAATRPDDEFLILLCFCPPVMFRGLARSFPGCQPVGPISKLTFPVYPIPIRYACQTVANV